MAFHFGEDASPFDWSSFLTQAVTSTGQVVSAAITGGQSTAYPYTPGAINPATGLPYYPVSTAAAGTSGLLLLLAAGAVAFLIFKKKGRG